MDETTLGPTGMSTSEAGREGAERGAELPRPAPVGIRLAARCFDFVILLLLFEAFTGSARSKLLELIFIVLAGIWLNLMEKTSILIQLKHFIRSQAASTIASGFWLMAAATLRDRKSVV